MPILADIAEVISGQSPPGTSYNEAGEGLPFFQGKAEFGDVSPVISKWCTESQKIAEAGDILISVRAPVGATNIAAEKCCIGRGLAAIRPHSAIVDRDYLNHFLRKSEEALTRVSQGSTFQAISRKELLKISVPLPPLHEQKRLADILSQMEGIIRLRKEQLAKTRTLIPALFIDMFGDPATNPNGWDVEPLGKNIISASYGTSKKAGEIEQGEHPMIRMGNVTTEGALDLLDLKYVTLDKQEYEKTRLLEGDILFNRTNSKDLVGKTGIWQAQFDAVAASYFIRVRVNKEVLNPYYVWAFMNTHSMKRKLFETARGAIGQANINAKELRAFDIPIPDISLQNQFQRRLAEIRESEAQIIEGLKKQQSLFQSLLHHAFQGTLFMQETVAETISSPVSVTAESLIGKGWKLCKQHGWVDPYKIANDLGIPILHDGKLPHKGEIRPVSENAYEIVVKDKGDHYSIAHELAHIAIHPDHIRQGAVGRKAECSLSKAEEKKVDSLAAEILMPELYILAFMEEEGIAEKGAITSQTPVSKAAKQFRVSDCAMCIRLMNLGYRMANPVKNRFLPTAA